MAHRKHLSHDGSIPVASGSAWSTMQQAMAPCAEPFQPVSARFDASLFRAAPLVPHAAGLVVGIIVDERIGLPLAANVALFFSSILVTIIFRQRRLVWCAAVIVIAFASGAMIHASVRLRPPHAIETVAAPHGMILRVRGHVESIPHTADPPPYEFAKWHHGSPKTTFVLQTSQIEGVGGWVSAMGLVRVTCRPPVLNLRAGQEIEMLGRLKTLRSTMNPGSFDWSTFLRRQGIHAEFECESRENIVVRGVEPSLTRRALSAFRSAVRNALIDQTVNGIDDAKGLMEAIVLGHRSQLDQKINDMFLRSGCAHFLAASGTNVGMLAAFSWLAARILRLSTQRSALFILICVGMYVAVADPRPPILRSSIMIAMVCLAPLIGRRVHILNSMSASAILILAWQPTWLFDAGFQLSYAAVFGIVYVSRAVRSAASLACEFVASKGSSDPFAAQNRRAIQAHRRRLLNSASLGVRIGASLLQRTKELLVVGVGAWLAGAPVAAYWFQTISPWGALNSCLMVPLVGAAMIVGFIKTSLGLLIPVAQTPMAGAYLIVERLVVYAADRLAQLPGSTIQLPSLPTWFILIVGLWLTAFTIIMQPRRDVRALEGDDGDADSRIGAAPATEVREKFRRLQVVALCISFVAIPFTMWILRDETTATRDLRIALLSVGRASTTVLELPGGKTIMYDAGSSFPSDVSRSVILPYLHHRCVRSIDHILISHANLDHFSGVPGLVGSFPVGPIIVNHLFEPSCRAQSPAAHLINWIADQKHPWEMMAPSRTDWVVDGVRFQRIWPPEGDAELERAGLSTIDPRANDASTVLRVSWKGSSILLTGDIDERSQRALIQRSDLAADVLVLPHHGATRKPLAEFIAKVGASILVRSSSESMTRASAELRWAIGAGSVYSTADHGAVTLIFGDGGIEVVTHKGGPPIFASAVDTK